MKNLTQVVIFSIIVSVICLLSSGVKSANLHKRSFAQLGCMGEYDKAKFARLDRVCEECYQMFREPDIHTMCRWVIIPTFDWRNSFVNRVSISYLLYQLYFAINAYTHVLHMWLWHMWFDCFWRHFSRCFFLFFHDLLIVVNHNPLVNTGKTALPTKSSAGVWRLSFLRRSTKNSNRTSPICQPVGSKR